MIVFDAKEDFWELMSIPFRTTKSSRGLIENWHIVVRKPDHVLPKYHSIPVPVFTEWWTDAQR